MTVCTTRIATTRIAGSARRALVACALLAYLGGISMPCVRIDGGRAADAHGGAAAHQAATPGSHASHVSVADGWCGSEPPGALLTAPCRCGCGKAPASAASPLGYTLPLAGQPLAAVLAGRSAPIARAPQLPDPPRHPIEHVPLGV